MQRWLVVVGVVACSAHDAPAPQLPEAAASIAAAPPAPAPMKAPGLRLPDGVTPLAYDLHLELDPDVDGFRGKVAIQVQIDGPTDRVWIHADELELVAANVRDGTRVVALRRLAVDGDQMIGFALGSVIDHRTITLEFEFTGQTTHDQEGLFRQRDRNRWYLFSQGESMLMRRIVPCFDEPRFKAPWRVTLVIPKGQRGFGNMPVVRDIDLEDGRHEVAFAETGPIASYLVAVAVGPFELVDAGVVGKLRVPVRVLALAGDRERVGVVASRLPAIVDALEKYAADPLPCSKLDLVAVPHLFGAMENPGLVTFDAAILVGDPKQRDFSAYFTRIAAHELAHQWFGNLVTPVWWNDLWLSEAFASWLGDRVAAETGGIDQPQLRRALTRERALEADAAPTARALRHAIERNDDPDNAFDSIAYDKGEAVLATFEAWIGEAPFRDALRRYLHDHRDSITTTADLIAAVAAVSTPGAANALAGYVDHVGAPVVDLALSCEGSPRLIAHARGGVSIPICVRYAGGPGGSGQRGGGPERACTLVGDHSEFVLATCPAWIYTTDTGYYHVAWSTNGPHDRAPPLAQLAPSERIALGDDLAAATQRGEITIAAALDQVRELVSAHDLYGEYAAVAIARAIDPVIDDATRDAWSNWLAARFATRLAPGAWFAVPRTTIDARIRDDLAHMVGEHAPKATVRRARAVVEAALAHHAAPEPTAVALAADQPMFDRVVALARVPDEETRDLAVDALGEFGAGSVAAAVGLIATPLPAKASLAIVASYFARGATRTAAWAAVRAQLPELLAHLSNVEAAELIDDAAALCDPTMRAEVAATFEAHVAQIFDSRRRLARTLGAIDRCIARRAGAGELGVAIRGDAASRP